MMYLCRPIKEKMAHKYKKRPVLEAIALTGIADKGKCIGRTAEGAVVFVEDAVPGDVVDVQVTKKKSGYFEGYAVNWHSKSVDRTVPLCAHFGICGGCKWQNLTYAAQLHHKEQVVVDAFRHLAKVGVGEMLPILGCESPWEYRNKLEFTASNKVWLTAEDLNTGKSNQHDVLGFHRPGAFDKAVDIEHCHLMPAPSNALRNFIKAKAKELGMTFFDLKKQYGMLRTVLFRYTATGELMVNVVFYHDDIALRTALLDAILGAFPTVTTLLYCINGKANDTILDQKIIVWHGVGYVEDKLGDIRFRIGPKSFFQTNTRQAVTLYDVIVRFADLQGTENVYDLYTGLGSIALYLARKCGHVVGIEEIAPAIEDAKINAELNGITNTTFYAGDVKNILTAEFSEKHGKPDVLITDPPRAGMHAAVVQMLLQLAAPKLVYVSCNPATQARDLQLLSEKYDVAKVQPVDMFPHTHHIENVALLTLRSV